jgi:hypothetical protein
MEPRSKRRTLSDTGIVMGRVTFMSTARSRVSCVTYVSYRIYSYRHPSSLVGSQSSLRRHICRGHVGTEYAEVSRRQFRTICKRREERAKWPFTVKGAAERMSNRVNVKSLTTRVHLSVSLLYITAGKGRRRRELDNARIARRPKSAMA